jgi:phospholipase/carboxylesterase
MRKTIGQLECLIRPGEDPTRAVILLHGFGADASDLFPLADVLDPEENWSFYFPEGPLEVPIGPMMSGRGWFPISVRELDAGVDFTNRRPPKMDEASAAVYDLIFNLNVPNLILGGFSQGAMVAVEVALNNATDVAGLVLLSGSLLDSVNWASKAEVLKGKPYFQSHGMQDQVLPFTVGQKLNDLLVKGGAQGGFLPFMGGHEIPKLALQKAKEFLSSL